MQTIKTERNALSSALEAMLEVIVSKDCTIRSLEEQLRDIRNPKLDLREFFDKQTQPNDEKS